MVLGLVAWIGTVFCSAPSRSSQSGSTRLRNNRVNKGSYSHPARTSFCLFHWLSRSVGRLSRRVGCRGRNSSLQDRFPTRSGRFSRLLRRIRTPVTSRSFLDLPLGPARRCRSSRLTRGHGATFRRSAAEVSSEMQQPTDGKKDACSTYIEQTKLLVTLASVFVVAPAALIPLFHGRTNSI